MTLLAVLSFKFLFGWGYIMALQKFLQCMEYITLEFTPSNAFLFLYSLFIFFFFKAVSHYVAQLVFFFFFFFPTWWKCRSQLCLFIYFYFIIFTFTHMCIHCLHTTPLPYQAEPVPLSCSLILLKRKYKT
jgi:hypothetical protein